MKEKILKLLSLNNIDEAISFLESVDTIKNNLVSIKNQRKQLKEDSIMGVLSHDQIYRRQNSIVKSLIQIVDNCFTGDEESSFIEKKLDQIVDSTDLINSNLEAFKKSQAIILAQIVENHDQLFESRSEQRLIIGKIEEIIEKSNSLDKLPDDWYDRPVKDKIKLSIPFFIGKWERELDITGAKIDWKNLKRILIKDD